LLIKNTYTITAVAHRAEGEFLLYKENRAKFLISITSGNSGISTTNQRREKKLVTTRAWIKGGSR
jgi:hypothetical protein